MATILRHKIGEASYKDHELLNPVTTAGRSSSNDIVINDTSLSRLHMRLENRGGQFYLVDNNSSNGTFLNRRKITEAPLKDGDEIQTGRIHFVFVQKGEHSGPPTRPMTTITNDPAMASTMNLNLSEEQEDLARTRSAPAIQLPPVPDGDLMPPTEDLTHARDRIREMNTAASEDEPAGDISVRKPPELPPQMPPQMPFPASPGLLERATPLHRLAAVLLDSAVGFGLCLPGILLGMVSNFFGTLVLAIGGAASLAHLLIGWHKHGKTLGKHLMGLRVIEVGNPEKIGLEQQTVLIRLLGFILAGAPCGLGHLYLFFNEDGYSIQDKLAKTEVIRETPQV